MGNVGRIKKEYSSKGMDVKTKRRLFRGKDAKGNKAKVKRSKLVAEVNPEYGKKKKNVKTKSDSSD